MAAFQRDHPRMMTLLSTHDSKRSEDVRARLAVLSELSDDWAARANRWREHLGRPDAVAAPDELSEYYLFQTLVGAHPLGIERARTHMVKAAREAKLHTSWLAPDLDYEQHLLAFVDGVLADPFMAEELDDFAERIRVASRSVSLAQKAVQLLAPGVPDLYQGSEGWNLTLVDPDNRDTIDVERLARLLAADGGRERTGDVTATLGRPDDPGFAKTALTRRLLHLRRRHVDAFGRDGTYEPVWAVGPRADHAVAFCRGGEVVVVTPAPRGRPRR